MYVMNAPQPPPYIMSSSCSLRSYPGLMMTYDMVLLLGFRVSSTKHPKTQIKKLLNPDKPRNYLICNTDLPLA